jgi:hypothetical protein
MAVLSMVGGLLPRRRQKLTIANSMQYQILRVITAGWAAAAWRVGDRAADGIVQGADGRSALQLRLSAPPVEGAANKALIVFLAEALSVRKAAIAIRSGETARLKMLFIEGDGPALTARLDDWIARTGG